jgi:hypothetical protein
VIILSGFYCAVVNPDVDFVSDFDHNFESAFDPLFEAKYGLLGI